MTFRQFILDYLESCGMFPQQAQAVLDSTKDDEPFAALNEVLGNSIAMLAATQLAANAAAVTWIDANMPRHFARPMFA